MLIDSVREKNFIHTHTIDQAHLRSKTYHKDLLTYRVNDLSLSVIRRLQKYKKRGLSFHHTFLKCQDHLITLAKAYFDLHVVTGFQDHLEKGSASLSQETNEYLTLVYEQFALQIIYDQGVWYLKESCFSSKKWEAIRKQLEKLNKQIRPHIHTLIDGFGIPDHCIGAPIAQK